MCLDCVTGPTTLILVLGYVAGAWPSVVPCG